MIDVILVWVLVHGQRKKNGFKVTKGGGTYKQRL